VKVYERHPRLDRVLPNPGIQRTHRVRHDEAGACGPLINRKYGSKNHANPVRLREFNHRRQILFGYLNAGRLRSPTKVIHPSQNEDHARVQTHNVLPEPEQHLAGGLTSHAATEVRLAWKQGREQAAPVVHD
jgi:hypothetical protein